MAFAGEKKHISEGMDKNDNITLQTVLTLGIASQSWSRTKFGGQTYSFQFIGIGIQSSMSMI